MTAEQRKRIFQAIDETERILDKERSYTPEHQDAQMIAVYEAVLARLLVMLAKG